MFLQDCSDQHSWIPQASFADFNTKTHISVDQRQVLEHKRLFFDLRNSREQENVGTPPGQRCSLIYSSKHVSKDAAAKYHPQRLR